MTPSPLDTLDFERVTQHYESYAETILKFNLAVQSYDLLNSGAADTVLVNDKSEPEIGSLSGNSVTECDLIDIKGVQATQYTDTLAPADFFSDVPADQRFYQSPGRGHTLTKRLEDQFLDFRWVLVEHAQAQAYQMVLQNLEPVFEDINNHITGMEQLVVPALIEQRAARKLSPSTLTRD